MASDVSLNTVINQQQNTSSSKETLAGDFSDFLTLLTTQLQNQDPLAPMDSTEFTNQLVAFAGVEQQINTNQKLDSLVSLQYANAFSSSLSYVGLDANYLSNEAYYDGEEDVEISYAIDGDAQTANLFIYDADGNIVQEFDLSNMEGVKEITWDGSTKTGGQAPEGTYSLAIEAVDAAGKPITDSIVVKGRIRGLETQNGSIFALIGERAVPVGSIINVSQPKTTTPVTPVIPTT